MREILFRAKRKDNGEWVEGGYTEHDGKVFIVTWIRYMPDTRDWNIVEYYENNPHYTSCLVEVIPETVCQYTGWTDKNGRKIFEGDILREFSDCNDFGESNYYLHQIRWDKEYCAFEGYDIHAKETFLFPDLGEIEIVGNIFDNPELLKGDDAN